ncbi:MAG TPA: oxidoreductase, partial [Gemmatimonadales bacterium]
MTPHKISVANEDEDAALLRRLRAAADLLEEIVADRGLLAAVPEEDRHRLLNAAGQVYVPDTTARRRMVKATIRQRKAAKVKREESALNRTGIRALRRQTIFTTPNVFPPADFQPHDMVEDLADERQVERQHCYVCKQPFSRIHPFYDQLCPACAELNFAKRTELADLSGRVALLTGGRVKIGYHAGLKLLRSGAQLIVTTRFPRDSATRYAREPDFADWADRLEIFGLDLRHTPSVEAFCHHLDATRNRLDFIINNACQTVRRPPDFYRHMMEAETASLAHLPEEARGLLGHYEGLRGYHLLPESGATSLQSASIGKHRARLAGLTHAAQLSQVALLPEERRAQADLFPRGVLDQDLQQVDLRQRNSWRLLLAEVSSVELLEVQLVNAIAPFIINARLKPLMLRTPGREKH